MRHNIEHNINYAGEKPYNQCITCPDIGVSCDGPNFLAMSPDRRAEWARIRKEYLHRQDPKWTNAYIAEMAGVSKVTVDRFLAGTAGDLRMSTIEVIMKVLVNGSWGQYPCANPVENRTPEEQLREVRRLQGIIEDLRREHRENMAHANDDSEKKIAYLKNQVDKLESSLNVAQKKDHRPRGDPAYIGCAHRSCPCDRPSKPQSGLYLESGSVHLSIAIKKELPVR